MTINDELMRNLYPEWYEPNPFHPVLKIFLAIAITLLIPYLVSKLLDSKLLMDILGALRKKIRPPRPHLDQLLTI